MEKLNWDYILRLSKNGNLKPPHQIIKSTDQWKSELSLEVFRVTRLKGTESPFSSEMCQAIEAGKYNCVCCRTLLFDSTEKFDSGTGWPSFTQPVDNAVVGYHADNSYGSMRVEVVCNVCESHLGHVFPDGPRPSGLRYCVNALSLQKV